ncbi:hypothetical protein [Pseudomonas sp. MWU12-2345]|uniref:hypothetical protein n=1 Tax=Pseudomonas sp. MWU12-2345 TaxID=2928689 RepID=UPI00200F7D5F|nr:hypothetical protein [Pseudomonas sp. MWU12-2345]
MTDRELLELAAKSVDIAILYWTLPNGTFTDEGAYWNPLADDGDAHRLAVKLGLYICNEQERAGCVTVSWGCDAGGNHLGSVEELAPAGGDDYAASRRAIVRAAAEIGRAML